MASGCVRVQPTLNQNVYKWLRAKVDILRQPKGWSDRRISVSCSLSRNEDKHFLISIAPNAEVDVFKELVKVKNAWATASVDAADLRIWKVDSYVPTMLHSANQPLVSQLNEPIAMSQRMEELPKRFSDLPKYCERMDEDINDYFKEPPPPKHIHIIVGIPGEEIFLLLRLHIGVLPAL